jgi:GTP-binding protein HflX
VRDAAHGESEAQKQDVLAVLKEIGRNGRANGNGLEDEIIEALNKIDLLSPEACAVLRAKLARANAAQVAVSAVTGEGIPELLALLDRRLASRLALDEITLAPQDGADLAWLYAHGEVIERHDGDDAIRLKVRLDPENTARFKRRRQPLS